MDHHKALKLVPLQLAHLKTSGCAEFGPLNMKESDVLAQNVFYQKQIIIKLWNLYHCNWHTWKLQGVLEFGPLNTKESDVLAQNVFSQKWIIIQLWNLYSLGQLDTWIIIPENIQGQKTWRCAEFGPLNMKESDVLAQNVFSQKWIIIQLWNLYHCNWHAWKLQGVLSLAL